MAKMFVPDSTRQDNTCANDVIDNAMT